LRPYQREVGHAAIDAGADLIIGTHPHILKGIEVYKGKVIFYSLGNFAMDSSVTKVWPHVPARWRKHEVLCNFTIDPEWGPTYPFPSDSRKTIIAKCTVSDKKIETVSFLPALIVKPNQPQILPRDDGNFDEVVKYVNWICEDQNFKYKTHCRRQRGFYYILMHRKFGRFIFCRSIQSDLKCEWGIECKH
jgi:poly-gamma-glutamate synthesis protein (capsule biosynthesis protein)